MALPASDTRVITFEIENEPVRLGHRQEFGSISSADEQRSEHLRSPSAWTGELAGACARPSTLSGTLAHPRLAPLSR